MKETLEVINRMVDDGVIKDYAIGGAVAAIYYLEPFDTADLDIFVVVDTAGSGLTVIAPIYDYLLARGHRVEGEFVHVEGQPVQFLPVFNALTEEAVAEAHEISYAGTATRVMRGEHLVAIMLDTGRAKDFFRINMFLEQRAVDLGRLEAILRRHDLTEKWLANEARFRA